MRLEESTLNLYTPSKTLPIVSIKVFRVSVASESLNIRDNLALKKFRGDSTRFIRVDEMCYWDEMIRIWTSEDAQLGHYKSLVVKSKMKKNEVVKVKIKGM